jgi:twitching motility protein PilT
MVTIDDLIKRLLEKNGTDLHLKVGRPPVIRISGNPMQIDAPPLSQKDIEALILPILTDNQKQILQNRQAVDFTYEYSDVDKLRSTIFYQEGMLAAVLKVMSEGPSGSRISLDKASVSVASEPNLNFYLREMVKRGGSDLHLKVGRPPLFRIKGDLLPTEFPVLSQKDVEDLLYPILNGVQRDRLNRERELDFSYVIEDLARFRGNYFYQMDKLGGVFRGIPMKIVTLDELGLPDIVRELAERDQGLILITGPTGSGKSTTLAAMINHINERSNKHIITIEDPLEFVHQDNNCVLNQREVGADTYSFAAALKHALRQDPDVIMVGEMRDPETIHTALTASETGHLVMSTLHTTYAKQSISRIVDAFEPAQQNHIRIRTAMSLVATVAQKLVKRSDGSGRVAVMEVMINTPTIRKMILEEKLDGIDKSIAESAKLYKMQTTNQHLFDLTEQGVLTRDDALNASYNPNDLRIMFQTKTIENKVQGMNKPPFLRK